MSRRAVIALVIATALVHLTVAWLRFYHLISIPVAAGISIATAWSAILILASRAGRQIIGLQTDLRLQQDRNEATRNQLEQLATLNEMLLTLGRSNEVGLAFQSLAGHVGRLVPADRLGLALLRENGQEVLTYSARISEPERRRRPRPELQLSLERSLFGKVIRSCEALVIDDLAAEAATYHDAAVLASQGFHSALVLPLVSRNRAIGALMVISRLKSAFALAQRDIMQPLAEVLAFAFVGQQQQHTLEKFQMMESMSDTTFAVASEINGALQGVIGEASMLRRQHPELADGLDVVIRQAERTLDLLERMRAAAHERLGESGLTAAIPASPEAFGQDETF
jgi:transcriptional regulator with GAF, ATPase, and Fis domain